MAFEKEWLHPVEDVLLTPEEQKAEKAYPFSALQIVFLFSKKEFIRNLSGLVKGFIE
jgi:hypothetical protein